MQDSTVWKLQSTQGNPRVHIRVVLWKSTGCYWRTATSWSVLSTYVFHSSWRGHATPEQYRLLQQRWSTWNNLCFKKTLLSSKSFICSSFFLWWKISVVKHIVWMITSVVENNDKKIKPFQCFDHHVLCTILGILFKECKHKRLFCLAGGIFTTYYCYVCDDLFQTLKQFINSGYSVI